MNSTRRLMRWGSLTLLVALMGGCCVAPWGGRGYDGHDRDGAYGGGGHQRGDRDGDRDGGRWHH